MKKNLLSATLLLIPYLINAQLGLISGGTGAAYTLTYPANLSSYDLSMNDVKFKAHIANTGTCTMSLNGLTPLNIVNVSGATLAAGDIIAGQMVTISYDGTKFQMITPPANMSTGTGSNWGLIGNAGTTDAANFIGTKDLIPFNIRVNDQKAGRIDATLFNTFLGYQAGNVNSTGSGNLFTGYQAGLVNTTGTFNTYVGYGANGTSALTNATAIGKNASVTSSNSFVLGGLGADTVHVGIGIANPTYMFEVHGSNLKGTTAALWNIFQIASRDATSPLALRMGLKTDITATNRFATIEVDDAGTAMPLILQSKGGKVGIGATSIPNNVVLSIKDGHIQCQQTTPPAPGSGTSCGGCPAPVLTNATDVAGKISFTPTNPSTPGDQAKVTFGKIYAVAPIVVITPTNATAAIAVQNHQVFVSVTTGNFTINYQIDPDAAPAVSGAPNTFNYFVIETQ